MKLVDKPDDVAAKHTGVPAARRKALVGFLQNTDPDLHGQVIKTWKANGLPKAELELAEDLLGLAPKTAEVKAPETNKPGTKTKDTK